MLKRNAARNWPYPAHNTEPVGCQIRITLQLTHGSIAAIVAIRELNGVINALL